MTDLIETARRASELEGRALFILAILLLVGAVGWLVKYTVSQHQALAVRHETITDQYHQELVKIVGQHSELNTRCALVIQENASAMGRVAESLNYCRMKNEQRP